MTQRTHARESLKPLLVPDALHRRIKLEAVKRRIMIRQITEPALEAWLRHLKTAKTPQEPTA